MTASLLPSYQKIYSFCRAITKPYKAPQKKCVTPVQIWLEHEKVYEMEVVAVVAVAAAVVMHFTLSWTN